MANVKFYRLSSLNTFQDSYKGIFVNLIANVCETDNTTIKYKKGLYFGGESGWEYLTNDTDDSTVNKLIDDKINTLNSSATIASNNNGIVTLYTGITETDGKIGNTDGPDADTDPDYITLAKVATTGEATDVAKSTDSSANYNVTAGEISDTWKGVVNGNKLADGDSVDVDLNKLDTKIAGLADELINDEKVINNTFSSIKTSVGLESDFTLDITGTNYINGTDTNVKSALTTLDSQIKTVEGNIKNGSLSISGSGATTVTDTTASIPTAETTSIHSANASDNSTITLGAGLVWVGGETKTINVRTNQTVSATNPIATMNDIASLSGAMHYKGVLAPTDETNLGVSNWPTYNEELKAGDTYIVKSTCTKDGITLEAGDMVVFTEGGTNAKFNVVQTNMNLGTNAGQYTSNVKNLTSGKIVVVETDQTKTGFATSSYSVTDIASEATSLSANGSGTDTIVTVSDTLTVGGTAQTANSFKVKGGNKLTASLDGNDTIVLSHDTQTVTTTALAAGTITLGPTTYSDATLSVPTITVDSYGHVTANQSKQYTISLTTATLENAVEGVSGSYWIDAHSAEYDLNKYIAENMRVVALDGDMSRMVVSTDGEGTVVNSTYQGVPVATRVFEDVEILTEPFETADGCIYRKYGIVTNRNKEFVKAYLGRRTVSDYFAYEVTSQSEVAEVDGLATALNVRNYINSHETVVNTRNNSIDVTRDRNSYGGSTYYVDLVWLESL